MVGGRKEEGGFSINNSNVFAALDTLKKKKNNNKISEKNKEKEVEKVVWEASPLKVTSWADVDDDDDDYYYATSAPLSSSWGPETVNENVTTVEESESEDDLLELGYEEVDDELENDIESPVHTEEQVVKKAPETPAPPKETERQLSKKERKKKELEELEALLADFGVADGNGEGPAPERKTDDQKKAGESGIGEMKDAVPAESKNAKKKKKKDKAAKEAQNQIDNGEKKDADPTDSSAGTEQVEEDASSLDVKERLKKLTASKKKKSSKEMDGAAKAAALEAAARNARLASSKKKEKSHYNQQPVR